MEEYFDRHPIQGVALLAIMGYILICGLAVI